MRVYMCVCDVSHGTRLTQHLLASHNIPFKRFLCQASPGPAADTPDRILGKKGWGGGPRGPSIRPGSGKRVAQHLTQLTNHNPLPCSCPPPNAILIEKGGGEGKEPLARPWFPPTCSVHRPISKTLNPNQPLLGLCMRVAVAGCAYAHLIKIPAWPCPWTTGQLAQTGIGTRG